MGIETIVGAGLGLIGSSMQADAAGDAADAQRASSEAAIAEQRRQYDLTRQDYAPWRAAGVNALQSLVGGLDQMPSSQEVMQDPGYQFGMQQGQQALDRKAAAAGGRVSGAALKAASRFGTDYASSGYNAAYQRRQDRLNRLQALAGIGQTATNSSAAAGQNMANNVSGMMTNQGDNAGSAMLQQGSVWGNAANRIGALYARSGSGSGVTMPTSPYSNYSGDYNSLGYQP